MVNKLKEKRNKLDVTNYKKTEISDRVAVLYNKRHLTEDQLYNNSPKEFDYARRRAKTKGQTAMYVAKILKKYNFEINDIIIEKEQNKEDGLGGTIGTVYSTINDDKSFYSSVKSFLEYAFYPTRGNLSNFSKPEFDLNLVRILPRNIMIVPDEKTNVDLRYFSDLPKEGINIVSCDYRGLGYKFSWNNANLVTVSAKKDSEENVLVCLARNADYLSHELHPSAPFVRLTDIFREKYEKESE
jgi:hypothetical protein